MKNYSSKKLVISSMLAALICVSTMVIKIPSPLNGYINLGDCFVLLAGWILPTTYGFLAAGVGSAMADIFSGYAAYAPVTFLIKGVMAVAAHHGFGFISKSASSKTARAVSGAVAEIIMVTGYLFYESILYGFVPSLANVPANCVQGLAGLLLSIILIRTVEGKFDNFDLFS